MKKIIALALVLVMLFALSACGKEEAPEVTEAPAVSETEEPVIETIEPIAEPTPTPEPEPTPVGIEPDSGMYTVTSTANGISFEYDSKYVAMQNPAGNITVFAGTEAELPYCIVALMSDTDAASYLNDMVSAVSTELGDSVVTAPKAPEAVKVGEKEVQYIYYTYNDDELGAVVACSYYAETLESGETVVYSYTALEENTVDVESIIAHAIETFALAA